MQKRGVIAFQHHRQDATVSLSQLLFMPPKPGLYERRTRGVIGLRDEMPTSYDGSNEARTYEEHRNKGETLHFSFLGGCLRAAEAGALGVRPDASKRHQGAGGPYTRHSQERRDDMPRGTTECPRCSRPGDLLKQKGGNSTLGFPPGGAGGW